MIAFPFCKVNYNNDKFIHAPTLIHNKVMQLFHIANVVECK